MVRKNGGHSANPPRKLDRLINICYYKPIVRQNGDKIDDRSFEVNWSLEGGEMKTEISKWQDGFPILIGILFFGSIWGLFEVVLGSGLRAIDSPYRAGSLLGMGMLIMGIALAIYKRPAMLVGIGLIAGLFKLLAVPILHISIMCKANSSIAVLIESLALSLVAIALMERMDRGVYTRMGAGGLAALISAGSFYFVGMRVAPCPYLLSFNLWGFLAKEGLSWMTFSAILLPVGYLAGLKLRPTMAHLLTTKPTFGYATCIAISAVCWGVGALTIIAGS